MRELKFTSYQWLRVTHIEWLTFAEQALDNGFYSVAAKVIFYSVMLKVEKEQSSGYANESFDDECFANQIDYTFVAGLTNPLLIH